MAESKTYSGGCQCGHVRYEVTTDLDHVVTCNCSICSKTGALRTFVAPEKFKLLSGEDLRDHQFAKKHIHHLFCPTCGVHAFARGSSPDGHEMVAVNVRCLDDVDPASLRLTVYDGKSM